MGGLRQTTRKYSLYHRYSILPLLFLASVMMLIADRRDPRVMDYRLHINNGSSRKLATCHRMFSLPRRSSRGPWSNIENQGPPEATVHATPWLASGEYLTLGRSLHRLMREDAMKNGNSSPFDDMNEENILRPFMGQYPFLPCTLRHYDGTSFNTCLSRRFQEKQSLDIFFIGDSKIRNIFGTFLNATRAMKYNLSFMVS